MTKKITLPIEGSMKARSMRLGCILGAIIGDFVGSRFEFNNCRSKNFEFFHKECEFTDDTVMTLAILKALNKAINLNINKPEELIKNYMISFGKNYEDAGYGLMFQRWLYTPPHNPYNSLGNGSAMRVSSVPYFYDTLENVRAAAEITASVTHNHPEGIKGAVCTAELIHMALAGYLMDEIKEAAKKYYYVDFTLDEIRDDFKFDETCEGTVPYAIVAFLESTSFEDAIRNAISIGGDSDTIACITGSIAGAFYGVPSEMEYYILNELKKQLMLYGAIEELNA